MNSGVDMSDTDKKIILRDHDILIAVHTLLGEMTRRLDDYINTSRDERERAAVEMKELSIHQARLESTNEGLHASYGALSGRMGKLEDKSVKMDLIGYALAAIAGLLAWFK
jgi:hypothetical protein